MSSNSDKRARAWTFVGYPGDSLPEDWLQILQEELNLCGCVSPEHNADLNGDGSQKKNHRHFLVVFDGMKSFTQVKEITDRLHCPIPQVCHNVRSLVRYFCHIDNPEKEQYRTDQIVTFGGCEIDQYFARSQAEYNQIAKEIRDFIRDNQISEFCDLIDIADAAGKEDWVDLLQNRMTLFFSHYLKSVHFKQREVQNDV